MTPFLRRRRSAVTAQAHRWQRILSVPLPQAVREAKRVKAHRWHPESEAETELLGILSAIDRKEIEKVSATLFRRTTRILPNLNIGLAGPVGGFGIRHPVAALVGHSPQLIEQIVTVDRTGIRSTLYEGPAYHQSLCALDSDTVIARREFDGRSRADTELVEYTSAGETVLAHGMGLLDAVVRATARGYVVGMKLTGQAVAVAVSDGSQEQLDLREFGLRRADLLSVDATGDRIVFADRHTLLVTDSSLRPLHHSVMESIPHGAISAVAFTRNSIITAGYDAGLCRWQIIGDHIRGLHSSHRSQPRQFLRLKPVIPWGLLVAEVGNVNYYYDIDELEPLPAPRFLLQSDPNADVRDDRAQRATGGFMSSVHGRLAVYQGGFARPALGLKDQFSTVIQDMQHPLHILLKPLGMLDSDDANRVMPYLSDTSDTYELSASDRALLDAAVRASRWATGVG